MKASLGSYKSIILLLLLIVTMGGGSAMAQDYRYEGGVAAGISGYLGDVNQSNVLKNPGFAGGVSFRYMLNKRFAVKAELSTAKISGNSADFENKFPQDVQYQFSCQYYDLGASFEVNFLNFGMNDEYRKLQRITPYLSLGLGVAYSSAKNLAANIPIGFGVKYKLAKRVNLGLEMKARMMLGDGIDGLKDLYGVESGSMKNTDWCPTLMFSVCYEFGEICKICHYVK